jgi:hypothetical protein
VINKNVKNSDTAERNKSHRNLKVSVQKTKYREAKEHIN